LCRADDRRLADRLNDAIKCRDFWMPFAPTVLDEGASRYLDNPKGIAAPYMILTFPTTEEGRAALAAATHPRDGTARPQVLGREQNPEYYALVERYAAITGVPAVLNTSFNIHGEPIVLTAADALDTLARSGLRHLAVGRYLVNK
jgi:carbamoyltransferase